MNESPDITSPTNYQVATGQNVIGTIVAVDEDNVVMEYGATTVT